MWGNYKMLYFVLDFLTFMSKALVGKISSALGKIIDYSDPVATSLICELHV